MGVIARSSERSNDGAAGPIVLAAAATGIVPFIERLGGDIDGIFGNAGIAPDMAGQPTLRLKLSAYCRLFEESSRRTGNENFGLWFGNQFQPRDLGMWGYAAVSSPTLGAALANLVTLFPYHQESSAMRLARGGDGLARLEYAVTTPAIVHRRQDAELSLGMFLNVIREACGRAWAPEEVHFEHPKPAAWREHEAAFGAPVCFGRRRNALVFRPEFLDRPMPARDPRLMAMMRTCLESMGSHGGVGDTLFDRIRATIRASLADGYPELAHIAGALHLAPSLIQRELAEHGLTYRAAVEEMRRTLAAMFLEQRALPLTEIAFLLGYSELSAFSRAFTRWTGTCPREHRRAKVRH
ncbi:MAG: AraC family transcriptional regulator [Alphaproteobacteria bacterium]|nr:AraC family transcriptional regulator [Alphaproteobacteria bacterium]